jgi:hypothetical protein
MEMVRREGPVVKRPVIALSAAALLLSMLSGTALGVPISGTLDQANETASSSSHTGATEAQTFTAGITGQLTTVELWALYLQPTVVAPGAVRPNGSPAISLDIRNAAAGLPTGGALATATGNPGASAGWVVFTLSTPIPVVSGTQYAIVFTISPYANVFLAGSYSGGTRVGQVGGSWVADATTDYAFRTYVWAQSTTLHWSQGQVPGGASTPVTLTETFTFPATDPQAVGASWAVVTAALPAWFTPTGVVCSVGVADCAVDHLGPAKFMSVAHTASPLTVIVTISGTAAPAAGDIGTLGTASGRGCSIAVVAEPVPTACIDADAALAVVAVVTTPPPGTAESAPAGSEGSASWPLPAALAGLFGLAYALNKRRLPIR